MGKAIFKLVPGKLQYPMAVHNFGVWVNQCFPSGGKSFLRNLLLAIYHFGVYLSVVTKKVQIEEFTIIGPDLWLSPRGRIIIGAKTIGANCVVHHNVTIGMNFAVKKSIGVPVIGDNVTIEANSLIFGDIYLGDRVLVREGTVVSKSVPPDHIIQGNPGRVVGKRE